MLLKMLVLPLSLFDAKVVVVVVVPAVVVSTLTSSVAVSGNTVAGGAKVVVMKSMMPVTASGIENASDMLLLTDTLIISPSSPLDTSRCCSSPASAAPSSLSTLRSKTFSVDCSAVDEISSLTASSFSASFRSFKSFKPAPVVVVGAAVVVDVVAVVAVVVDVNVVVVVSCVVDVVVVVSGLVCRFSRAFRLSG